MLGIFLQRLEFRRAALNSITSLSQAALRFLAERRFYLAAAILKFELLFKFRLAVRRGAKFKKRKQTFCKIRLRRKNRAAL